jgi:hypothetical protein
MRSPRRAAWLPALDAQEVRRTAQPAVPTAHERVPSVVDHRRDELVTRLAHGSRRIEVAPRPAPVVQDRAFIPGELQRAAASTRPRGNSSAGDSAEAVRAAAAGTVGPVDLDQLTDQVVTRLDARLIAHRERFGRGI